MGGIASGASRPLASLFGAEQEAKRGPTLGSAVLRDPEGGGWRLMLVGPLRVQVFDASTAQCIPVEDASVTSAMNSHVPFTACSWSEEPSSASDASAAGPKQLAIGCQDGTVLVFALVNGMLTGPLYELKVDADQHVAHNVDLDESEAPLPSGTLAMSVTALRVIGHELYAGACGRCRLWDLRSGELRREFHLPGGDQRPVTPGAICVVRANLDNGRADEGSQLWIGLDNGGIAVFNVQSGVLVRSFSCAGPESVVALALFRAHAFVFALSAHRRVSVWDATTYSFLQKFPAELITCGADLSAMVAVDVLPAPGSDESHMALLLLAGIDGSMCIRRVGRRNDGKLNCVLLSYLESVSGNPGCPITCINYHAATDSALLGDAGCTVSLLSPLKEQLGNNAAPELPRLQSSQSTPSSGSARADEQVAAASSAPGGASTQPTEAGGGTTVAAPEEEEQNVPEAASSSPPAGDAAFPVFSG